MFRYELFWPEGFEESDSFSSDVEYTVGEIVKRPKGRSWQIDEIVEDDSLTQMLGDTPAPVVGRRLVCRPALAKPDLSRPEK